MWGFLILRLQAKQTENHFYSYANNYVAISHIFILFTETVLNIFDNLTFPLFDIGKM